MRGAALTLASTLAFAACSGSVNGSPPTPAPINPELSILTQRVDAQMTMAVANGIQAASLMAVLVNAIGTPAVRHVDTAATCKNGIETTVVEKSPETFVVTIGVFYDASCTNILTRSVLNVAFLQPAVLTVNGTATTYTKAGRAIAFATLTNRTNLGTTSYGVTKGSIALSPSGPSALSFGLSCTLGKTGSCGFGGLISVATLQQAIGVDATIDNFVASGASSNGLVTLNGYAGALGHLKLEQAGKTSWRIVGGAPIAVSTGTFTEDVAAARFDVNGNLAMNDHVSGANTSASFGTRTGIANGVVQAASKTFASFSTDATGDGSIHYSNGSTGKIVFFIITG